MKRLSAIAILLTVLLIGWLALAYARNREPRYQGRALTDWLVDYDKVSTGEEALATAPAKWDAATNALEHIGTNAIPFLLKKLSGKDDFFEHRLRSSPRLQSLVGFRFADPKLERQLAWWGFGTLSNRAMSAVPALTELASHPDAEVRATALRSLACVLRRSERLLPILLPAVHDPDEHVRTVCAIILDTEFPEEAEKAGVYKEFPDLKPEPAKKAPSPPPVRHK